MNISEFPKSMISDILYDLKKKPTNRLPKGSSPTTRRRFLVLYRFGNFV